MEEQVGAWYSMAQKLARGTMGRRRRGPAGQRILWSANLDVPFVPASTVKLLTTGFARSLVGGDARRETRVIGVGQLSDAGEWKGRWWLELNGDVTLERLPGTGPDASAISQPSCALPESGSSGVRWNSRSQTGTADAIYPAVWSSKHRGRSFAPLVGPLMFHENIVMVGVSPGIEGRIARRPGQCVPAGPLVDGDGAGHDPKRPAHKAVAEPGCRWHGFVVNGTIGTARPGRGRCSPPW